MTDTQTRELTRRNQIVCAAIPLLNQGGSYAAVARRLGENKVSLYRWVSVFRKGGDAALIPQSTNSGRKADFNLTDDEAAALRYWRLVRGSLASAIPDFTQSRECRPETRAKILAIQDRAARDRRIPNWPMSLRRAGHVTADDEALFRGCKHFQEVEFCQRRGNFIVDEAGNQIELAPNTIWESDDMSVNEPFSYVDADTGETKLGRQTLWTQDVYSAKWIGTTPLGRAKDAYRVEDIADHIFNCVLQFGLPTIWRIERGVWDNNWVDGFELPDGSRWGGLDALMRIQKVFKSRGKGGIESNFNLLQTINAHKSTSIGRSRSEFEAATKLFLSAQKGNTEAAAKFWNIAECADGLLETARAADARAKQRRAFGRDVVVPNDLYAAATKREIPADQLWRFCPIKRSATVRGGHVEVSVNHYPLPFRFRVNGVEDLHLEQGYAVLIAFHPGRAHEGCHVFSAETGSRNRFGLKFSEKILLAPMAEDAPQISMSRDEQQFLARRKANAAARTEFRAIVAAGTRGRRESIARDSYGNTQRIETQQISGASGPQTDRLQNAPTSAAPVISAPRRRATPEYDEAETRNRIKENEDALREQGVVIEES